MTRFGIERGFGESERAAIVALLREYEAGLGVSLCFQGFEAEVAGLPGAFAPPGGQMLLARDASRALAGLVALRPVPDAPGACEMKRLYVRPAARGSGLGHELAVAAMEEARRLGYRRMCLATRCPPCSRHRRSTARSGSARPVPAPPGPSFCSLNGSLPRHDDRRR